MGSSTTASRLLGRTLPALMGVFLPLALAAALLTAPAGADRTGAGDATTGDLRPAASALRSSTYQTFTLNIKHDLNKKKARADMVKAFTLGDAGGLQEMSDLADRQTLMNLARKKDWGWYMPRDGGVAIPIIWKRQRFRLIEGRTVKVHGPENKVTPSRYINVVRLREIATGKVFGFINTHTISQASFDAKLTNMHRIPRLRKHLKMLRSEIVGLFGTTEHVFVSGDLNVNYLADRRRRNEGLPTDALGDLVSFDMPLTGSRGPTSLLDYGMTVKVDGGLARTASKVVRGFHSDHDAVVFTYRPLDLFETGPLFNGPRGKGADRKRVLSRQARAVMNAEPGALVRVATARLDDPGLAKALLAAHAEGVLVRVVVGRGKAHWRERQLASALGTDRAAGSWFHRCVGTCLGGNGRQEANFLLVSRAGGTSELTLASSHAAVKDGRRRFTDVYRTADSAVYAAYGKVFGRMAADTTDTAKRRVLKRGQYQLQLYPVPDVPRRDPVLSALSKVGCKNARGLRTGDGRTNVRAAVHAWSGERGQRIVTRLGRLKKRGCDVALVLGPKVLGGIRKQLKHADIPTRRAAVGQNVLVVDGRYKKRAGAHFAWTGGPGWTQRALASDGVTLVVSSAGAVRSYLDGFTRAWRSG